MKRAGVALLAFVSLAVGVSGARQDPAGQQPDQTPRSAEEMHADLLMVRKLYSEAVEAYLKLLEKEPRNALLLNKIGIGYHQQLMLDRAKRYYERAMKVDKKSANAINNLGTIYYQRKNYRKAIKYYKQALAASGDLAPVYSNLGYAYFAEKKYEDALDAFRHALVLDPLIFERRNATGSLLQDRTVENRALFYFFLAKSFAMQGNAERCAYYLKKARDEGYKNIELIGKDPAFAGVVKDPLVQEVLRPNPPSPPAS